MEAATLALQAEAGCPVTFSRTAGTVDAGVFQVVVEYTEEAVGRLALELAQELIQATRAGTEFDFLAAVARLRNLDEDERLGPSTGAIVQAAIARGIPWRRLTQGSLVQLGWGSRQRRIQAAEIDATSAVAEAIAQDKDLTKQLLHAACVPVPLGRPVDSADEAWRVAQEIGLPVVIKPQDGNQGKGVTVNITTREHLDQAYQAAIEIGDVMVEQYLPGNDFRLLVVGNHLVAAARRDPPRLLAMVCIRCVNSCSWSMPIPGVATATPLRSPRFASTILRLPAWLCRVWARIRCLSGGSVPCCATTPISARVEPQPT